MSLRKHKHNMLSFDNNINILSEPYINIDNNLSNITNENTQIKQHTIINMNDELSNSNNENTQTKQHTVINIEDDTTKQEKNIIFSIDDIHTNLILISNINPKDKMIINNNLLNIDTSYIQSISRKINYNNCNRNATLLFINNLMQQTYKIVDELMDNNINVEINKSELLQRLGRELKNSIDGLLNLKTSYYYDKLTMSSIDVIIDNINNKLNMINNKTSIKK